MMSRSLFLDRLRSRIDRWNMLLTPGRLLGCATGSAVLFMLCYLLFCNDIYRDVAACYTYYAGEWSRGNWLSAPISALPPLTIFAAGLLARTGLEIYSAVILLSALFYILMIFPLYGLLLRFFPARIAAWGTVLYVLTPKIIRHSGMGLLESGRDFFLVLALYLLFRFLDDRRRRLLPLLCGASLGFLSLTRGEGGVVGLLLLILLPVLVWRAEHYRPRALLARALPFFLLAALGMGAVLSPRLIEMYRVTGYPVTDSRMISVLQKLPFVPQLFEDKRKALFPRPENPAPLPKLEHEATLKRLVSSFRGLSRGAYELYFLFALAGLILVIHRRQWRMEYTVFALIFVCWLAVFYGIVSAYRYYSFAVPLLMVFTLTALCELLRLAEKVRLRELVLAALAVIFLLQISNGLDILFRRHELHELAGWIKAGYPRLFPEHDRRRPVIHTYEMPELLYYLNGVRRFDYSSPEESPATLSGCDFIMLRAKYRDLAEEFRRRSDLEEVSHPFQNRVSIFIPVRRNTR